MPDDPTVDADRAAVRFLFVVEDDWDSWQADGGRVHPTGEAVLAVADTYEGRQFKQTVRTLAGRSRLVAYSHHQRFSPIRQFRLIVGSDVPSLYLLAIWREDHEYRVDDPADRDGHQMTLAQAYVYEGTDRFHLSSPSSLVESWINDDHQDHRPWGWTVTDPEDH